RKVLCADDTDPEHDPHQSADGAADDRERHPLAGDVLRAGAHAGPAVESSAAEGTPARASATMRSTTSSALRSVESTTVAPGAWLSGDAERPASSASRRTSACKVSPTAAACSCARRCAR